MNTTTEWKANYTKPKCERSLYNLCISKSDFSQVIVRDCRYNIETNQFTQIDDQAVYDRFTDILEWQKQYLPNNKSNNV